MIDMSGVEAAVLAAKTLASQVVAELDPAHWAHELTDPSAAADMADYVVGATQAVASNMQVLATHFSNYSEMRNLQDNDARLCLTRYGKPYPIGVDSARHHERELRLDAYERAVFVSIGSVLDTLAATLIGYAGLGLDIHHADFGWLLPMDVAGYPTEADNKRLWKGLAPEGTRGREEQLKAIRAFATALEQSGPAGWVTWALSMRNMFVHREHRTEFIVIGRSRNGTTIDRVPVADPSASNMRAFRAANQLLRGYYLQEDVKVTMEGLIGSLNAAVTATVEVLRRLWDARRDTPSLISQPSAQWRPRPARPEFAGYAPGTALIKKGVTMLSNPEDAARLKAGGLLKHQPQQPN